MSVFGICSRTGSASCCIVQGLVGYYEQVIVLGFKILFDLAIDAESIKRPKNENLRNRNINQPWVQLNLASSGDNAFNPLLRVKTIPAPLGPDLLFEP